MLCEDSIYKSCIVSTTSVDLSVSSNTASTRLLRRRDDRSKSRKASKRRSQASRNSSPVRSFYIKMPAAVMPEEEKQPNKEIIPNKVEPVPKETPVCHKDKKRQLTPNKSRHPIVNQQKQEKLEKQLQAKKDLLIAQLEEKYLNQKKARIEVAKKCRASESELLTQHRKVSSLELTVSQQARQLQVNQIRILELQSQTMQSQQTLRETRNNLQRIKQNIRQNRQKQISLENSKLSNQNIELREHINILQNKLTEALQGQAKLVAELEQHRSKQQIEQIITSEQLRQQEIEHLKRIIQRSATERETLLEHILRSKQQQCHKLKLQNDKLHININYVHRKTEEQVQIAKAMMQYEVQSLRTKLSQTVRKLADKQKEYTTLLSTTRKNKIFAISSPEDLLILELSPENKQPGIVSH